LLEKTQNRDEGSRRKDTFGKKKNFTRKDHEQRSKRAITTNILNAKPYYVYVL